MIDSDRFRHLDSGIAITTVILILCGLVAIYSATFAYKTGGLQQNFGRQLAWACLGLCLAVATVVTHFRIYYKYAYSIYAFTIILLLLVLFKGTGTGSQRWLAIGGIGVQPAEFAKIGALLALCKYLCRENRNINRIKDLAIAFVIIFLPFMLILRQPDLGSALVFLAILLPILHWAGLSVVILFILIAPVVVLFCAFNFYSFTFAIILISLVLIVSQRGLRFFLINFVMNISVGIFTPLLWNFLKDYQRKRILSFLGLVTDPSGLGYQVIQSKVAIGSGGVFGKGFLHGTQTHLRFLPEQHTDFILSVIGEEFGFFGVVVILLLFMFIIFRSLKLAASVKSKFLSLLTFGATAILTFEIFVNIGMTVGIMPVTGLPLPFLSYGGSAMLTNCILVGFILNASLRRFEYV